MMRTTILAIVICLLSARPSFAEPLRQIRLESSEARSLAVELERGGYDILEGSITSRSLDLVVSVEELASLERRGLVPKVLAIGRPLRDIQAEQRSGLAPPPPPEYPDLGEVLAELAATESAHPAIARVVDLTTTFNASPTVEGRHLYALKISDNVGLTEDEPAFLLVSTHHAREIVTPVIALNAIQQLVNGYGTDPSITALVDQNEIWVAPVWNPDGYDYVFNVDNLWRKNRRVFGTGIGVDLNRNYPQGWSNPCSGSTSPGSETYKGPSPASEAETQTMLAFSLDRRFAKILDYHSFGREVIHGYLCWTHPFAAYFAQEATELSTVSGYNGGIREPSADGEHYQWQFALMGSHAFLIETHTAFQPPYSSAVAEAQLLWPGVVWMLEHPTPLWGYVTDSVSGQPVQAAIDYVGINFPNGERNASGGPEGRYHAFLPAGTYSVRFAADGYTTLTVPGVVVTAGSSTRLDAALVAQTTAVDESAPPGSTLGEVTTDGLTLRYEVLRPADVVVRIYDVRGNQVTTLVEAQYSPGQYSTVWSGRNENGRRVASGSYFYRLKAGVNERNGKLLLTR